MGAASKQVGFISDQFCPISQKQMGTEVFQQTP